MTAGEAGVKLRGTWETRGAVARDSSRTVLGALLVPSRGEAIVVRGKGTGRPVSRGIDLRTARMMIEPSGVCIDARETPVRNGQAKEGMKSGSRTTALPALESRRFALGWSKGDARNSGEGTGGPGRGKRKWGQGKSTGTRRCPR